MNIDVVKEFFAASRDEALAIAASHYGVASSELSVRELPESLGISGLGGRSCFLVWVADEAHESRQRPAREGSGSRGPGERSDEGRRRDRDRDRDRDRGRGGRSRGGRGGRGNDRGREASEPRGDRGRSQGDRPEGVDEARLEDIARQAAERVKRSGEPEILESMSSKERWVVHNFLKEVEGVASVSEGEGASKRVKIVPV